VLDPVDVEKWRLALPEMPDSNQERLQTQYGIPAYDAGVLSASRQLADWFERAVAFHPHAPKEVSNWVMGEVLRVLNERQIEISGLALQPEGLAELLALKDSGEVSGRMAKSIFEKMLESGKGPRAILEAENLGQISDDAELRALASSVLDERSAEVAGYLDGRTQLLSFFIGEVMKKTRGRANPKAAGELLRELLEARRGGAPGAPSQDTAAPREPVVDVEPTSAKEAGGEGSASIIEEPPHPPDEPLHPSAEPPRPPENPTGPLQDPPRPDERWPGPPRRDS
jgi:hypothetical protein